MVEGICFRFLHIQPVLHLYGNSHKIHPLKVLVIHVQKYFLVCIFNIIKKLKTKKSPFFFLGFVDILKYITQKFH